MHYDPLGARPEHLGRAVVSIGVFDGLHVGHRFLLDAAAAKARELDARLIVVTFDQDPDEFFIPPEQRCGKLLGNESRLELIARYTDALVVSVPASRELFAMEPQAFLDALDAVARPVAVYVGCDFRFGAHAAGTVDDIAAWCAGHGSVCMPCELLERDGAPVTATRIRGLLAAGEVSQARELLAGRAHSVQGVVERGRGEGAGLGFATANVALDEGSPMLPAEGVYGGYGTVCGQRYAAAINVGVARTFEQATALLEAHLLDYGGGELYGQRIEVSFVQWLREPRVFASQDELVATVTSNIEWVREHLGSGAHGTH